MGNRRRFVRVRARLRFTFAWDEQFELYTVEDVCASGVLVRRTEAPLTLPALGAVGECAFAIDASEVRTQARVVRLTRDGFAVRFLGLSRTTEDTLVAWVFRREAQALAGRMPA